MRLANLGSSWTGGAIDGLRAWNSAGARFQFSWGEYSTGSLSCGVDNSRRDVLWGYTACGGLGDNTLAVTHSWYDDSSNRLLDADVVFNLDKSWDVYSGRLRPDAHDFRRVATHEFGHVLGLAHPDDHGQRRAAIMNSRISDIDRLQSDDIDGIRAIYGSDRPLGTPDLVVRSVQTSPRTLTAGGTFTLSASVHNVGNGTSPATTLRYYYYYRSSSREWVVVGSDSVGSLSPSASSHEAIRLTSPSRAGTHFFDACVAAVRGERDTSNCSGNVRVTVTGAGTPDLVVESARATPATLAGGEVFTFSATVRNVGSGTSPATTLRYYYYRSSSREWVVAGTDNVESLSPSSSSPQSIRLTMASRAGTHYFNACVQSVPGERDTSNCSGNVRVTVRGGGTPDLVVQSLRTTPGTLTVGERFTLSATVRNVGSGTSPATTLRYYYYRSSSREWVVVGTDSIGSLSPSLSSPESIRLTVPGRTGTHYFNACVASVAGESNKENCSANLRVTVQP